MKKKVLLLFLVLVMSLFGLLAGCSGSNSTSTNAAAKKTGGSGKSTSSHGKVVVNFWSFWGSPQRRPVIQHMVDQFNKSQNKIEVKYTYLPWGTIWTKELAAVAAGNPPDVVIQDINSVPQRAEKKQIMDLSKFIKNDPSISKRYYPQLWKLMQYKGDTYALPFNTDTRVLFYNKDLFKKAGLDPNKPPQTWQQLWTDAQKIDKKQGNNYQTVGFYPLWGIGPDVWMDNADGSDCYFNSKMQPVINSATNVKVMNWLKKWADKYGWNTINRFNAYFKNHSADPFVTGKLGMYATTATYYTQLKDYAKNLNFGVALMPSYKPGSGHTSWGGGFEAEIPKGSKHPKAAFQFLKYLTGKKAQEYWASHTFDNVANIKGAEEASKDPHMSKTAQMVYKMATESVKHNVMTPLPLKAPDFNNKVSPLLDKALHGQMSVKAALDKAQQEVAAEVKQNSN